MSAMTIRKVIAECHDRYWLVLDEAQAGEYPTAESIVRMVVRKDRSAARRGESTTTIIEWRDVPEGFEPPDPEKIR